MGRGDFYKTVCLCFFSSSLTKCLVCFKNLCFLIHTFSAIAVLWRTTKDQELNSESLWKANFNISNFPSIEYWRRVKTRNNPSSSQESRIWCQIDSNDKTFYIQAMLQGVPHIWHCQLWDSLWKKRTKIYHLAHILVSANCGWLIIAIKWLLNTCIHKSGNIQLFSRLTLKDPKKIKEFPVNKV